jgi:hypothetical protein
VDVYYFSPPLHIIPLAWLIILAPRQQKSEKYIYIMRLSSQAALDLSLGACARAATGIIIILRPIAKGGGEGDSSAIAF